MPIKAPDLSQIYQFRIMFNMIFNNIGSKNIVNMKYLRV